MLIGDALIHLIPEILTDGHEEGHDHSNAAWLMTMVMFGVYVFILFDKYLHRHEQEIIIVKKKGTIR